MPLLSDSSNSNYYKYSVIVSNVPSGKDFNDKINDFFDKSGYSPLFQKELIGINQYEIKFVNDVYYYLILGYCF